MTHLAFPLLLALAATPLVATPLAASQDTLPLAPGRRPALPRTIALDERLAADAGIRVGDRVVLAAAPGTVGDTVVVAALVARGADPSEVARREYRVRMHLDHLQALAGYGDRADRFAVATAPGRAPEVVRRINESAFGFRAHRSADIAVETSRTFQVVSRFHSAIGVITIVASAIFLLCILLLKVEERRRDVAALRLMGISARTVVLAVTLEAAAIALLGSLLGTGVGWLGTVGINWYYQGVYRTPLAFALVSPAIVGLAVTLSIVLGVAAGYLAALRLVRTPPLALFGR
jgi:putative ABC transport system permease protein